MSFVPCVLYTFTFSCSMCVVGASRCLCTMHALRASCSYLAYTLCALGEFVFLWALVPHSTCYLTCFPKFQLFCALWFRCYFHSILSGLHVSSAWFVLLVNLPLCCMYPTSLNSNFCWTLLRRSSILPFLLFIAF